jgi:hypothetical protein
MNNDRPDPVVAQSVLAMTLALIALVSLVRLLLR